MATDNNGGVAAKPTWEEVHGSKNWEGLLDPLDLGLRHFILRAGDFCQCSSDAFNGDKNTEYYGNSRYGKKSFFNKVKFQFAASYQVYSLLYTTATIGIIITLHKSTSFQGFIAASTDAFAQQLGRREIVVVWRGTETDDEWVEDAKFFLTSAAPILRPGTADPPKVMQGFLEVYTNSNPDSDFTKLSARDQLHAKLNELKEKYKGETLSIVVTGHSLGGALAVLSAFDLVENGVDDVPVTAVTFGGPRVGDAKFKERAEQYGNLHVLRVVNKHDHIPTLPSDFLGYTHVGVELEIDGVISPCLKTCGDKWHNLQVILHGVAGWDGKNAPFDLSKVKRSLALVNKSSNFLKAEYKIPESWSVVENKGMIVDENGEWIVAPPLSEDIPQPEF